jgi:hypothetical protein
MKQKNTDQFELFKKTISEEEAGGVSVEENAGPTAEDVAAYDKMMAEKEGGAVTEKKVPQSPGQRQKTRREGKEEFERLREDAWKKINEALIKEGKKPEPGTPVRAQEELPLDGAE